MFDTKKGYKETKTLYALRFDLPAYVSLKNGDLKVLKALDKGIVTLNHIHITAHPFFHTAAETYILKSSIYARRYLLLLNFQVETAGTKQTGEWHFVRVFFAPLRPRF
jgi:hypothetical protein